MIVAAAGSYAAVHGTPKMPKSQREWAFFGKRYCLHIHLAQKTRCNYVCSFTQIKRLHIVIRKSFDFIRIQANTDRSRVQARNIVATPCHSLFAYRSIVCRIVCLAMVVLNLRLALLSTRDKSANIRSKSNILIK